MASLSIQHVSKSFGDTPVLRDVSIEIEPGEFFSLLGPSGCGKSTLLRIIAGLEVADSGSVRKDGSVVDSVPPQKRGIGMVFQQYALWPHMTIGQNVRFGLESLALTQAQREERLNEALDRVQMQQYRERYPHEISGGQQQRVALARALAMQPSIILLDEPLSNLDARLRAEIRYELSTLHRTLGTTMVYVTHDQEDALALSSRIAVMRDGVIEQVGSPREIYERPVSPFVAKFIGDANLLPCRVVDSSRSGFVTLQLTAASTELQGSAGQFVVDRASNSDVRDGESGYLCVRPSNMQILPLTGAAEGAGAQGMVRHVTYRGSDYDVEVELADATAVRVQLRDGEIGDHIRTGERVSVSWDENKAIFLR